MQPISNSKLIWLQEPSSFRTALDPTKENQIIQAELGAEVLGTDISKLGLREPETRKTTPFVSIWGRLSSDNSKVTPNVTVGNYTETLNGGSGRGSDALLLAISFMGSSLIPFW